MKWVRKPQGGKNVFALSGDINEHSESELEGLEEALAAEAAPVLDMAQTAHINSLGLTYWHRFCLKLEAKKKTLELRRAPMPLVRFVNMLGDDAKMRASIRSVLAPSTCESCSKDFEAELDRQALAQDPIAAKCPACGGTGVVDNEDDLRDFGRELG